MHLLSQLLAGNFTISCVWNQASIQLLKLSIEGLMSTPTIAKSLSIDRAEQNKSLPWDEVIDELLRIRILKDDWDGEGSPAPEPCIVDGAIAFAQYFVATGISPPHRAHAGVNGTIYFEWYLPQGYREVEVLAPDRAESRSILAGVESNETIHIG